MPELPPSRANRIAGCLLAGALGDAIGAHFEGGQQTSKYAIPTDLRVTDDTQLTIAACESLIESHSIDPESVANHFLRWFRERRISGIGASTLKAFTELEAGGHWAMVGATGEYSAGNGAAMRIAPLAFFLDPDVHSDRQTIRDVCRITHRNDEAYIGALVILRAIRHAINGDPLDRDLLSSLVDVIPDSRVRDRLIILRDSSLSAANYCSQFAASGYVVDSVPLAVLLAIESSDALSTIEQIASIGGDADTIASMFGQIFGAAVGLEALPIEVIDRVDASPLVRKAADCLARILIAR